MSKVTFAAIFVLALAAFAFGQPRPVDTSSTSKTSIKPAPPSFEAKYEGGMFGYSKKEEGSLKFDDANSRLVFFDKLQKEMFAIPYHSMLIISPQSQSVQSTTGKVVSVVPYAGIIGGFIKEKRRYLVISFDDPDVEAKGTVNFKIDNQDLLDSALASLAQKAELKPKGDAYYRPRATDDK